VSKGQVRPVIFWEGFPVCGLIIKSVIKDYPDIKILATKPSVPFHNLELILGRTVQWLQSPNDIWEIKSHFSDRNLIIHTGWNHKGWLRFDTYMKKKYGAKVVVVVDNRYKLNIRQIIGALYFRSFLRKIFDAAFVPGKEGIQLMRFLGMPINRIFVGNYGAFEDIYYEKNSSINRNNEFLYVGQLIKRKGIELLIRSFKDYRLKGGKWNLRIIGEGPLRNICFGEGII